MKEYKEIIRQKGLPEVGQTVRSKKYGTLWRVRCSRILTRIPKPGNPA